MRQARAERADDQQPAEDEHRGLEIGHGPRQRTLHARCETPLPCRSGSTARGRRRRRRWTATPRPTWRSSAAASPACGPPCWPSASGPDREVVLLEAETAGWGASGRNGGFVDSSLTHGLPNGASRFPRELDALEALGRANLAELKADLGALGDRRRVGGERPAVGRHAAARARRPRRGGRAAAPLRPRRRGARPRRRSAREVASPTYLGGVVQRTGVGLVDPGALALGLRGAALRARRAHPRAHAGRRAPRRAQLTTPGGERARAAHPARHRRLQAAHARDPPARRAGLRLRARHRAAERRSSARAVGWAHRQGIADRGNQFHYYRLTPDGRVLFGGYDAIYHFGNRVEPATRAPRRELRAAPRPPAADVPGARGHRHHARLGRPDRHLQPLLRRRSGARSAGAPCTRSATPASASAATRFGARTALDLLDGADTERTRLKLVRKRPLPFPPEPLRWAVIQATRIALARADERGGRRGPWLRLLDRLGLGFDT